jgi:hypothetical protein
MRKHQLVPTASVILHAYNNAHGAPSSRAANRAPYNKKWADASVRECGLMGNLELCIFSVGCRVCKSFCMIEARRTHGRLSTATPRQILNSFVDQGKIKTVACFETAIRAVKAPIALVPVPIVERTINTKFVRVLEVKAVLDIHNMGHPVNG